MPALVVPSRNAVDAAATTIVAVVSPSTIINRPPHLNFLPPLSPLSPPPTPPTPPLTKPTSTTTTAASPPAPVPKPVPVPVPVRDSHPPNTVFLNVYDVVIPTDPKTIPRLNSVLVHCGIGIFHTGIQVWGREFAFGGHADSDTGIFEVTPRQCPAVRYRTTLTLGRTRLSERQIDRLINVLGATEYPGFRYSLIARNCNTFSAHLARLLGVADKFPTWVNRLAGMALNVRCLLPEPLLHPLCDGVPPAFLIQEPQKPPRVATL